MENAEFHGLSNENKLVHLVIHKWKELSIFIEKAWEQKFYIIVSEFNVNNAILCHA